MSDQRKLRFASHAPVGMGEQSDQFGDRPLREAVGKKFFYLGDDGLVALLGCKDAIDPPLARAAPTVDPVARVETAVETEVNVRGQKVPPEFFDLTERKPGAARLNGEGQDAAVGRGAAAEVAQEKM